MNETHRKCRPVETTGLKETIRILESRVGDLPDHVSLYIPADRNIQDVIGQLRGRVGLSDTTLGGSTRTSAGKMLFEIISCLRSYGRVPEKGLAVFCGTDPESDSTAGPGCIVVEPPEPVTTYLFRISTRFETEPLRKLAEGTCTGLLVLDLHEAFWGILENDRTGLLGSTGSNVPGKQGNGGQSAARFQQLRKIAIHEYFTRIGERAEADFAGKTRGNGTINGVIIGGKAPTREEFAKGDYFSQKLRKSILGIFDAPVSKEGLALLAEKAENLLSRRSDESGEERMREFLGNLSKGNGLSVYGEQDVRKNLVAGSVRTLLLSSALRTSRMHITCRECGHTDERTIPLHPGEEVGDILVHTCRVCDAPIVVDEAVDLIEEMTTLADQAGAETVIPAEDSKAGSKLITEFGGIAATLRYRTGF